MKIDGTNFANCEIASFPISEEQYNNIVAVRDRKDPAGGGIVKTRKYISKVLGYDRESMDTDVDTLFRWDSMTHKSLDSSLPLSEQVVDLQKLAVMGFTCSCYISSCTQSENTGCPIFRDPEGVKTIADSFSAHKQGDQHYIQINFEKFDLGYKKLMENSPLPTTAMMCIGSEQCSLACTHQSSGTISLDEINSSAKAEGVLYSMVEEIANNIAQIRGTHEKYFMDKPSNSVPAKVLIIGAGNAGANAAVTLKNLGVSQVDVMDGSDKILGTISEVIPLDKWDPKKMIEVSQDILRAKEVNLIMNTYIGEYNEGEKKTGKDYIRFSELAKQYDAIIDCSGKLNTPRSPGFEGEDNQFHIYAADFLKQDMEYSVRYNKALNEALSQNNQLDVIKFQQEYEKQNPYLIEINGKKYPLSAFDIELIGDGQTKEDCERTIVRRGANGNPAGYNIKMSTNARSIAEGERKTWPVDYSYDETTAKMVAVVNKQVGKEIISRDELAKIVGVETDDSGNIKAVKKVFRRLLNPTEAARDKSQARYSSFDENNVKIVPATEGKIILIVTAAGYSQQANRMQQDAGLVDAKGNFVGHNNYAVDLVGDTAIFVAGDRANGSDSNPTKLSPLAQPKDTVVYATQTGIIAAHKAFRTLKEKLQLIDDGMNEQQAAKLAWESTLKNQITPAMIFGNRAETLKTSPSAGFAQYFGL